MNDLVKELKRLISEMLKPESMMVGSITERSVSCGNANCRCRDKENPRKHKCHHLSYVVDGKTKGKTLKKADVEIAGRMTGSYRRQRELDLKIGRLMADLVKEVGFEEADHLYLEAYSAALSKLTDRKPEGFRLKSACERADKWKERAKNHSAEIVRLKVRIRDLEASRDKWKMECGKTKLGIKSFEDEIKDLGKVIDQLEVLKKTPDRK